MSSVDSSCSGISESFQDWSFIDSDDSLAESDESQKSEQSVEVLAEDDLQDWLVIDKEAPQQSSWGFAEKKGEGSTVIDSGVAKESSRNYLLGTVALSSIGALGIAASGGTAIPAALVLAGGASAGAYLTSRYLSSYQSAGMIDTSEAEHMEYWKDNSPSPTQMIPTQHCADTQEWRKKMIQAAEHNIVLSGNYCGGVAFDEILDLIKVRMEENPNLKVVIIASPNFIKDETIRKKDLAGDTVEVQVRNITNIRELKETYPNRFSLVESPDGWMAGSTVKKITNHTKYLGIDYGKYYILGGSAVKDNFNLSGVDNPLALIDYEGLQSLEKDLQSITLGVDGFGSLTEQLLDAPNMGGVKETLLHIVQEFPQTNILGLAEDSVLIEEEDFVVLGNRYNFKEGIDILIEKNLVFLQKCNEMLMKVQAIPDKGEELQRLEIQLTSIIMIVESYNIALMKFDNLVDAFANGGNEQEAFKEFLAALQSCEALKKEKKNDFGPLMERDLSAPEFKETFTLVLKGFFNDLKYFSRGIQGALSSSSGGTVDNGLIGMLVPGNFRDMDFIFKSGDGERSSGRRLFLQMGMLAYRWEQYNAAKSENPSVPLYDPKEVPHFAAFIPRGTQEVHSIPVQEQDTPVIRLLKEPMPNSEDIVSSVPYFDTHENVDKEGTTQLFFSGPEQPVATSEFRQEMLLQIHEAREEIVINHMYVHPIPEIRDALIEAARRGVKIKIITCGEHPTSPNGQKVFGPRNKYNYRTIIEALPPELRENVEVYEYKQNKKGLHKKVMIFDRKAVLAGSSNFGYKSLETSSDHEVNFLARSQKFAEETYHVCELDMKLSRRVPNEEVMPYKDMAKSAFHRMLAPLIG